MEENIHVFKHNNFQNFRFFVLMLPGLVFMIVLILFLKFSSYETAQGLSAPEGTQVLGTYK